MYIWLGEPTRGFITKALNLGSKARGLAVKLLKITKIMGIDIFDRDVLN